MKSVKFTFKDHRLTAWRTCSWRELNVEQVFEPAVLSHRPVVGHGAGAEHQAALLLAARVVGDHGVHVEVAALPHVRAHLDRDVQALVLTLVEQLVLVVGPLEDLPLLVRAWRHKSSKTTQ